MDINVQEKKVKYVYIYIAQKQQSHLNTVIQKAH